MAESLASLAFPAGDESDGSVDEWYIGSSRPSDYKASEGDEVVEDDVSRLKQALSKGDLQTVEQLLDKGVDVETRLGFEWTPLMCAVNMADHDTAKLLLDRGASASFNKGQYTVLMAGCTASAGEDAIVRCVELLLSRHADPNTGDRSGPSCLMLASRDGYSKLINLLVSHGAHVNTQDSHGYTALALAAQYGRDEAALKLLQLGADRTIRTQDGQTPADIALTYKHTRLTRILTASGPEYDRLFNSGDESLSKRPTVTQDGPESRECVSKLGDLDLLLHGLRLGDLSDLLTENDVTWSSLMTMEREDLAKVGITKPEDQQKVLQAVQEMVLDRVDMDSFKQLHNIDSGSEEFYSFMTSLQQHCCYLTETVQDVIRRFPQRASQIVFSVDPNREAQGVCEKLLLQAADLQREVSCLYNLLSEMDHAGGPCQLPLPHRHGNRRRWLLTGVTVGAVGALLLAVSQMAPRGSL